MCVGKTVVSQWVWCQWGDCSRRQGLWLRMHVDRTVFLFYGRQRTWLWMTVADGLSSALSLPWLTATAAHPLPATPHSDTAHEAMTHDVYLTVVDCSIEWCARWDGSSISSRRRRRWRRRTLKGRLSYNPQDHHHVRVHLLLENRQLPAAVRRHRRHKY